MQPTMKKFPPGNLQAPHANVYKQAAPPQLNGSADLFRHPPSPQATPAGLCGSAELLQHPASHQGLGARYQPLSDDRVFRLVPQPVSPVVTTAPVLPPGAVPSGRGRTSMPTAPTPRRLSVDSSYSRGACVRETGPMGRSQSPMRRSVAVVAGGEAQSMSPSMGRVQSAERPQTSFDCRPAALEALPEEIDNSMRHTASAPTTAGASNQFIALLESLEARVDLMSQMQNTRAAIQKRARAMEAFQEGKTQQPVVADDGGTGSTWAVATHTTETDEEVRETKSVTAASVGSASTPHLYSDQDTPNSELWAQFKDQRECIARLSGEVEGMKQQLCSFGVSPVGTAHGRTFGNPEGVNGSHLCEAQSVSSGVGCMNTTIIGSTDGPGSLDTTQHVPLYGSARDGRAQPLYGSPDHRGVMPLCRSSCGVNLSISEDGYTATRTRGCRQSVVVGSGPLQQQAYGWYFEVVIQETVAGWVGGLGIGVTSTNPGTIRRMPDKAWRIPSTFVVGYWGCVFLDGTERRTSWRSDTLCVGAKVGFLHTNDAVPNLYVFVNGQPVVRVDGSMLPPCAGAGPTGSAPKVLYPVVDVFASSRVVTLSKYAEPPPPPWDIDMPTLALVDHTVSIPASICDSAGGIRDYMANDGRSDR